mgnify:CR=1 FL=1
MTTISDWLNDRERLIAETTVGPWSIDEDWAAIASPPDSVVHGYFHGHCPTCGDEIEDDADVALGREDAEFIADARTALPAVVEALWEVLEWHGVYRDAGHTRDCPSCMDGFFDLPPRYPCNTVKAIAHALGVEP